MLKDSALLREAALINGQWVASAAFDIINNPATGEKVGTMPNMGAVEATQAVEAAQAAFPAWAAKLPKERSAVMRKWGDLIVAHADDLATILTTEQGKPLREARNEVLGAAEALFWFAEEARRTYGDVVPQTFPNSRTVVIKQPVGVCAAITPWNFPVGMITRKASAAIAVGCTIVLKPAPATPFSAMALGELAIRAGLPAGVLNIVPGDAVAIGGVMTSHPLVRKISFTGSTPVGKLLMSQVAPTVKRISLELGGHAPFIVFDDADVDAAVAGAISSKYRNAGQTCVCANRIFVQDGVYEEFTQKFAAASAALKVGNGLDATTDVGPLINDKALAKVEDQVADARAKGGHITVGGARHALGRSFYQPTVIANATREMKIFREETFGPVAPLFRFKTEAEVIEQANDSDYGLAAYFYARDLGRVWRVAEALEYGMVGINSALISTVESPFGGIKQSGLGREGSKYGADEYLNIKYLLMAGV